MKNITLAAAAFFFFSSMAPTAATAETLPIRGDVFGAPKQTHKSLMA